MFGVCVIFLHATPFRMSFVNSLFLALMPDLAIHRFFVIREISVLWVV